MGLVVAEPYLLGECQLQDYECDLLTHAVIRVDHAFLEGEEVVRVDAGHALQSDENIVGFEADGQLLAPEAAGEGEKRLADEPQLGQLQFLPAAHEVEQGEVVVLSEDLALLDLDAEPLLQLRADVHKRHNKQLLLLQPLVGLPKQAVPCFADDMRAPQPHDEASLLAAEEVHLPEAGVFDAFEEGECGGGVGVVAHLNCQNVIDIKLIIVRGGP